MAPKNIVLAAGLLPPGRPGAVDGAAGAGAATGAPAATGLPQLPQKRWPGAMASPQKAQTFGAAAALPNGSAAPLRGDVSAAAFLPTPRDAPQS